MIEKRFWSKVDKSGDCWEWQAATANGYGRFNVNGFSMLAHRYVLILEGIDIPSGMHVGHHCDNPKCVNRDHLFLGTDADNLADMAAKGRSTFGERNPQATLTEDEVLKIRESNESTRVIAERFGICRSTVSKIRKRKRWRHL